MPLSNRKLSRQARLLLCIVTEIHQLFQGRACTNTLLIKL